MDLLHLLKLEHDKIRCLLSTAIAAPCGEGLRGPFANLADAVETLIRVEAEFLVPEVEDLFPGVESILERTTKDQEVILSGIKRISGMMAKGGASARSNTQTAIADLGTRILEHIQDQQDLLIPKMRKLIPTQDREELGQIFLDLTGTSQERRIG